MEFGVFYFGILNLESPNLELTSMFKIIKMNTHKLFTIVVLCLGLSNAALASHHKIQRDQITNEYEINDGMLTGHFVSYYANGKSKRMEIFYKIIVLVIGHFITKLGKR